LLLLLLLRCCHPLGDDEAKRRGVQKSILERAAPPTFDVAVEMLERNKWHVYADVAAAVDALLAGQNPGGQMRERAPDGSILKYSYSRGAAASAANDGRKSSSSSSSATGQRVLPELRRPGGVAAVTGGSVAVGEVLDVEAAAAAATAAGGFVRPRLFVAEGQEPGPGEHHSRQISTGGTSRYFQISVSSKRPLFAVYV
jgi:hypothetical protein